ncbi:hypothetical protein X566_20125 [Afipia sp. P52-10]|uniref:hypothetical protein n=1 Tax=Afipia sp. P52-10 TaxID=1429916 RepID=UPI0003DF1CFA|nr:hypothetical protein [Afipia sp. P52-10]ETR75066.1 hypothetical protein X566_20125 [Afipia sp. P52-10]
MAIRTRIEPIDRDIQFLINEELSPAGRSAALAQYAREQFQEAQAINRRALGRTPDHETFVDGARTEAVERVRPDGTVVFEFELLDDLFGYIDLLLITHSPRKSGRYQRSHVLLADGAAIDPDADELPKASEFVVINTQPYARKIERGQSAQAPDGVYQVVAALAARRFGNMASIKFSYRVPLFGDVDTWANKTSMSRNKKQTMDEAKRGEWLRRQPAIVVRLY